MVDRGLEIDEGDETNNEAVIAVEIEAKSVATDSASNNLEISEGMFFGLSLFALVGIIGAFAYFMPAKVKKLQ